MAEFVEVMNHKKRMCETHKISCGNCDLIKEARNKKCGTCDVYMAKYPKQAEEIIMNWAKEHPVNTNADKFKDIFGFIPSEKSCPYPSSNCDGDCVDGDNGCSHYNFWNQEYKEPKGE